MRKSIVKAKLKAGKAHQVFTLPRIADQAYKARNRSARLIAHQVGCLSLHSFGMLPGPTSYADQR